MFRHRTRRNVFVVSISALALAPLFIFAWAGPTQSPPTGNVAAPINVGTTVGRQCSHCFWQLPLRRLYPVPMPISTSARHLASRATARLPAPPVRHPAPSISRPSSPSPAPASTAPISAKPRPWAWCRCSRRYRHRPTDQTPPPPPFGMRVSLRALSTSAGAPAVRHVHSSSEVSPVHRLLESARITHPQSIRGAPWPTTRPRRITGTRRG
jgi:hypothetical protein